MSRISAGAASFGEVDVLHVFVGHIATMRVKPCSVLRMVNAAGPELDRAETVTLFNDLCILVPAALIDAPVVWQPIDDTHVRGVFTNGTQTVSDFRSFDARRPVTRGEGRWHTTAPRGQFVYPEYNLDTITYNPRLAPASYVSG